MPKNITSKYGATRLNGTLVMSWENLKKYALKEFDIELSDNIRKISFDMRNKGGLFTNVKKNYILEFIKIGSELYEISFI